ncbi:hypothetical protein [Litoribrevibacter albus]|uniref:Uncharacterized protein n=1 Tax=Litoribrevibacter albus TaxID=1473156 RepID=A0AA37SBT5_9GAMM|nr:hypothetical protein [Litoribrevibacter albus]GLQ31637.1 hypothetical protein GCM10007876_21160 [Litoribrevibacter albus]
MNQREHLFSKLTELEALLVAFNVGEGGFDPLIPEKVEFSANLLFGMAKELGCLDVCGLAEQIRRKAIDSALDTAEKSLLVEIRREAWRHEVTLGRYQTLAEKRKLKFDKIKEVITPILEDPARFSVDLSEYRLLVEGVRARLSEKVYANLCAYLDDGKVLGKIIKDVRHQLTWLFDIERRSGLPSAEDVDEAFSVEWAEYDLRIKRHVARVLSKSGVKVPL